MSTKNPLFSQSFENTDTIVCTHNLNRSHFHVRLLVDGLSSKDSMALIQDIIPNTSDPLNSCTVKLITTATGSVQFVFVGFLGVPYYRIDDKTETYNENYAFKESNRTSSTTSSSYQNKVSLVYDVPADGYYEICGNAVWSNEEEDALSRIRLYINGVAYKECVMQLPDDNEDDGIKMPWSATKVLFLSAGSTSLAIQYRTSGGDRMYIREATLTIKRVK